MFPPFFSGEADLPGDARRVRLDRGGDPHGRLQRGHQDERRHRHPVGLLGWAQGVLREEQGLPAGAGELELNYSEINAGF